MKRFLIACVLTFVTSMLFGLLVGLFVCFRYMRGGI